MAAALVLEASIERCVGSSPIPTTPINRKKMNPIKKEELITEMLNKQLSYVGKTIEDVKGEEEWYSNYAITEEQFQEWKSFCMDILKKKFKYPVKRAELEFSFFNLNYGLRVKE